MLFFGKYLQKRGLIATPLRHISLVTSILLFRQTAAVKRVVGRGEAILAVGALWAGVARRTVPPPPSHSIVRGTSY